MRLRSVRQLRSRGTSAARDNAVRWLRRRGKVQRIGTPEKTPGELAPLMVGLQQHRWIDIDVTEAHSLQIHTLAGFSMLVHSPSRPFRYWRLRRGGELGRKRVLNTTGLTKASLNRPPTAQAAPLSTRTSTRNHFPSEGPVLEAQCSS